VYLALVNDSLRKHRPWVLLLSLLPLAAAVFVQATGVLGDSGITNATSLGLCALSTLLVLIWLAFLSRLPTRIRYGAPVVLAVLAAIGTQFVHMEGWWGNMIPVLRFGIRVPKDMATAASGSAIDLSTISTTDSAGFLGTDRDGATDLRLDPDWSAHPPVELWRRDVGEGWSSFALVAGVAITQEQRGEEHAVTAYDLETGALHWIQSWPGHYSDSLGGPGPRATPTVAEGHVYVLDPNGRLVCLAGTDGSIVWEHDLRAEYGMTDELEASLIAYGRANSPLVVDGRVIIPAGGDPDGEQAGLVAFDALTGERVWEGPPRQVSFASPVRTTLLGRDQVVIVNEDSISSHDPANGDLIWESSWPGGTSSSASISNAVPLPPDRVFISKGYGVGAALLQLTPQDGAVQATTLWHVRGSLQTKFTNVVIFGETAVGLSDGILMCAGLGNGRRIWKNGRYGHGQVLAVGEHLLLLSEEGELLLIDPSPDGAGAVLARLQVLHDKTWNQHALAGDLLAVRNGREAAVYRLPVKTDP
jgi:outer membrane protein assembly factor BamB